jgi:type I restriction enzyme, S subunit
MPDAKMVRLGDYCNVIKGKIGIKKAVEGEYPLVTTAEERLSHNKYHFNRPSVIIPLVSSTGHGHASLKRIHYQEGEFAVGSILCAVTPKDENVLNSQFLYHYLDVYKEKLLVSLMKGMANVTLSVTKIENVEFPLLSANKQKEWVSQFESTSSCTDNLTSEITNQQALLKKFRQSILQDAISGKLTETWRRDNPDVEPASELLARILAEREQLVEEKKIKKQKPLPAIAEGEIPFALPKGWVWCKVGQIGIVNRGKSPKYDKNGETQILNQKCVRWFSIDIQHCKTVSLDWHKSLPDNIKTETKDILVNSTGEGTIGRAAIVDEKSAGLLFDSHILRFKTCIESTYVTSVINSDFGQNQINALKGAKTTKQTELGVNNLTGLIFPLAPWAEQKAVMIKVEKLFTYCDKLDQQISKSRQDSELLMQTVLKEAFEMK